MLKWNIFFKNREEVGIKIQKFGMFKKIFGFFTFPLGEKVEGSKVPVGVVLSKSLLLTRLDEWLGGFYCSGWECIGVWTHALISGECSGEILMMEWLGERKCKFNWFIAAPSPAILPPYHPITGTSFLLHQSNCSFVFSLSAPTKLGFWISTSPVGANPKDSLMLSF